MANLWLRLWHDMPNDPKWRTISRASGRPIAEVISVYCHVIVTASQNVTRGHAPVVTEDLASALDVEIGHVEAILLAMQGRVLDGDYVSGWDVRQPLKEDQGNPQTGARSAAERKRLERERRRIAAEGHDDSQGVTKGHDESQKVTPDKDKDKDKEKNKTPTPLAVRFARFWVIYPKKVAKGDAEKAWNKIKPTEEILILMLSALEWQIRDVSWIKDGGDYIPNPATWLNAKRWEDEPPRPAGTLADLKTVPTEWWKSNSGIIAKGKEQNQFEADFDGWLPFKAAVLKAAGPGPWRPQ